MSYAFFYRKCCSTMVKFVPTINSWIGPVLASKVFYVLQFHSLTVFSSGRLSGYVFVCLCFQRLESTGVLYLGRPGYML